jgi:hypothetical protein
VSAISQASAKTAPNTAHPNAWIGSRYVELGRVLLLLESHYGPPELALQERDVRDFIEGSVVDPTFDRLHMACSPHESRRDFFARFACMNFCDFSVAPTRVPPTTAQLRRAESTLAERLERLERPGFVWVASKLVAPYATRVLRYLDIPHYVTAHPSPAHRHNVSDDELRAAYERCRAVRR